MRILVSAGEASGDLYAAALVGALRRHFPRADFFGCAGPRLRQAGVRPVLRAESLNVVGLVEVARHIPRIYSGFRRLAEAARRERPELAILTDSPDFHLRLAPKLRAQGVPVIYLVAPQVWAWRKRRLSTIRRCVNHLLCIFPFEEDYFRDRGVPATYIGHPLTRLVKPATTAEEFFSRHGLPSDRPVVVLLPGSRPGEIARHLPILADAAQRIQAAHPATFLLATPSGMSGRLTSILEPISRPYIQHLEGETWDAIAHASLALAASGTVTIEAALLGTPLVAFYKVSPWSWWIGKHFVDVPFFSMVNLVAGQRIVPELIQDRLTSETLAGEAIRLLSSPEARHQMQLDLLDVARCLASEEDPMERAASIVLGVLGKENVHARPL